MRHLLTVLLVLSLPAMGKADEIKPNTLTPKEISEGWKLWFDGKSTAGWEPNELLKVENGSLVFGKKGIPSPTRNSPRAYEFSFDFRPLKRGDEELVRYMLWLECGIMTKAEPDLPIPEGKEWYTFSIIQSDNLAYASICSKEKELKTWQIQFIHNPKDIPKWKISDEAQMAIRNVKQKPLKIKSIFNGKDLRGWKKFEGDTKRAKSQFSVTKEGWLSIKNGPGDLQTIGEWADFVLQLDCRTHGDNLNSGVFFRCIPGQYQNGYEAQIQNQKAKEPKKYTIQEYDPRTHELKGKKTIENWSQDYGTGAIYRRIPARLSLATDRKWFTMTILARGRHIATWVNGFPMVDWTDNRPKNENARNGCRLKKGPISLQGHDPTTDLNFRNIRIVGLAEKD